MPHLERLRRNGGVGDVWGFVIGARWALAASSRLAWAR
jgi:hypothetical protein